MCKDGCLLRADTAAAAAASATSAADAAAVAAVAAAAAGRAAIDKNNGIFRVIHDTTGWIKVNPGSI